MNHDTACIFIDGENLRHSLCDLFSDTFDRADYLPRNADWTGFFDALTTLGGASRRLRTYWYAVEHMDCWPWGLNSAKADPDKLQRIFQKDKGFAGRYASAKSEDKPRVVQSTLQDLLKNEGAMRNRFEGWKTFQDGIARRFDAVEFRRAGAIHYNLFTSRLGSEKAVDVKLATDLLELRNIYDIAIIVSGDQDYVPAVQAVKNSGKQVVNVSFLKRDGEVLPGGARRLNLATDRTLEMRYEDVLGFMRFPPKPTDLHLDLPNPCSPN